MAHVGLASSWDRSIVESVGARTAEEAKYYGISVLLAPGQNIHRSPLGGRNFEYFSEDPIVTGEMAASYTKGAQDQGVGISLKHYAANNSEKNRNRGNEIISHRAMREIYLPGYEIAMRENPWTVMSAYNAINGVYASSDKALITDVLRGDFGFDGFVVSDWGANYEPVRGVLAQMDNSQYNNIASTINTALNNGQLTIADVEKCVKNILRVAIRTEAFKGNVKTRAQATAQSNAWVGSDMQITSSGLNRALAADCMVLLKNDNDTLPLNGNEKIALVTSTIPFNQSNGGTITMGMDNRGQGTTSVKDLVLMGGGSGAVTGTPKQMGGHAVSLEEGLVESGFDLSVVEPRRENTATAATADDAAEKTDAAILVVSRLSAEGADNTIASFSLSANETTMINEYCRAFSALGKPVVVIFNVGGSIDTTLIKEKADAILDVFVPGFDGGYAIADILNGTVNPSARLTQTFPTKFEYTSPMAMAQPGHKTWDNTSSEVMYYDEGVFVGYRYYDTKLTPAEYKEQVAFPFGHGLSYTTFKYELLSLDKSVFDPSNPEDTITVTAKVTNTGTRAGKTAVQMYIGADSYFTESRPIKELKDYGKTKLLAPNESQTFEFAIKLRDLQYFDDGNPSNVLNAASPPVGFGSVDSWTVKDGTGFIVTIGGTSDASVLATEGETATFVYTTNPYVKTNSDTIINPINISYQYQYNFNARESADPDMIYYKGDYFLFASHGSGYWYTKDFADWKYVKVTTGASGVAQEWQRFAPGACVIGDAVYIAMSDGGQIIKSDNPYDGDSWSIVGRPISNCYDPSLFVDDDGRVFMYYGIEPLPSIGGLNVAELDPNNNMGLISTTRNLIRFNRDHGFENVGNDNSNYTASIYNEGLYCTKYNGRYYLQYSTPGTEFVSYANGCYVSESPTGPFTYSENSPISYKSTGFVTGAGHGSTIQDHFGNWWKVDTVSISQNANFERRLILYPAAFDQYGQFVSNTSFADYPMYKMTVEHDNMKDRPDWNLISYDPIVAASSSLAAANRQPSYAFNESMRDWWSAASGDVGEYIQADLGKVCDVNAVHINFADQDVIRATRYSERNNTYVYRYLLEFSLNGNEWFTVVDRSGAVAEPNKAQDTSHDYFELISGIKARYVRLTNKGPVPGEGKFAVSGLRLFGSGGGNKPGAVTDFTIDRLTGAQPNDQRSVVVSWDAVDGAEGYIIRFGNKPDSRNIQYKVINGTSARFNILSVGVDYFFSVDAYNDSGVTPGTVIKTSITDKLLVLSSFSLYKSDEGNESDGGNENDSGNERDGGNESGSNTEYTAKAGLYNSLGTETNAHLFIAAYDNLGRLIKVEAKDMRIADGEFIESTVSIPFELGTSEVKAFIWDASYAPLANALTLINAIA